MTLPGSEVDAVAVYEAALGCPGVAGLGSGLPGGMATYLPGRTLPGLRVNDDSIELEIRASWGPSAAEIGAQIRSAVRAVAAGWRLDITIADIELPEPNVPTPVAESGIR